MNRPKRDSGDTRLSVLLRQARPAPPLPPRFQENVWHRIEGEAHRRLAEPLTPLVWLDVLVQQLLRPRWALASLAVLIVAGAIRGAAHSSAAVRSQAQARYVSAVVPSSTQ